MTTKRLILESAIIGLLLVMVFQMREQNRIMREDIKERLMDMETMITSMFTQGRVGMEVK